MQNQKIFIAGYKGMVGSSLYRCLREKKFDVITKDRSELNLLNQNDVHNFFKNEKIDQVYIAAAKVGGIHANQTYPAQFIYENLMIQSNIIHNAFLNGVKKLLFLGSSCIYPKSINYPIKEEKLLSGDLESTNEPYAIAKIAGIKMCESYNRQYGKSHGIDYRSVMPTNLYGPGDNYHQDNSHVIPGLINRFYLAKMKKLPFVNVWGSGSPKREFLYVDDLARASIFVMNVKKEKYAKLTMPMRSHLNVGSGIEITIKELADLIKEIIGYEGEVKFDLTKPDGVSRKLLNSERLNFLGFKAQVSLKDGLIKTYQDYKKNNANI